MSDPRHPAGAPGQHPSFGHAPRPGAPAPSIRPGIAPMPVQQVHATEADLDPIELVDEDVLLETPPPAPSHGSAVVMPAAPPGPPKSKIKQLGPDYARKEHVWKRTPYKDGKGAIRLKTFHAKYSEQGMEHLDDVVNEWLDAHPEVEVKFVTSTVNVFEGKIREPALVLNVWY
jgi:hypothetical protein